MPGSHAVGFRSAPDRHTVTAGADPGCAVSACAVRPALSRPALSRPALSRPALSRPALPRAALPRPASMRAAAWSTRSTAGSARGVRGVARRCPTSVGRWPARCAQVLKTRAVADRLARVAGAIPLVRRRANQLLSVARFSAATLLSPCLARWSSRLTTSPVYARTVFADRPSSCATCRSNPDTAAASSVGRAARTSAVDGRRDACSLDMVRRSAPTPDRSSTATRDIPPRPSRTLRSPARVRGTEQNLGHARAHLCLASRHPTAALRVAARRGWVGLGQARLGWARTGHGSERLDAARLGPAGGGRARRGSKRPGSAPRGTAGRRPGPARLEEAGLGTAGYGWAEAGPGAARPGWARRSTARLGTARLAVRGRDGAGRGRARAGRGGAGWAGRTFDLDAGGWPTVIQRRSGVAATGRVASSARASAVRR